MGLVERCRAEIDRQAMDWRIPTGCQWVEYAIDPQIIRGKLVATLKISEEGDEWLLELEGPDKHGRPLQHSYRSTPENIIAAAKEILYGQQ